MKAGERNAHFNATIIHHERKNYQKNIYHQHQKIGEEERD